MDKLKEHYEELKKKYRSIFISILNTIDIELSEKTKEQKIEYLNNDIEKNIQNQKDLIIRMRQEIDCSMCGACCKLAISEFSHEQLREKAQNGDKYSKQFIETFIPYDGDKIPKTLFPQYLELIEESHEKIYYYHCDKVTNENKCPDYENRPDICRDYPDNPLQLLHLTCSFEKWHNKIQNPVLTIKAMKDIKNIL